MADICQTIIFHRPEGIHNASKNPGYQIIKWFLSWVIGSCNNNGRGNKLPTYVIIGVTCLFGGGVIWNS